MSKLKLLLVSLAILFSHNFTLGQDSKDGKKERSAVKSALNAFKFRSIGPAFMSGRIADIAIDPKNENVWYVAVGSGGVWKTENAGTTWTPLADNMPFYLQAVSPLIHIIMHQYGWELVRMLEGDM